MTLIAQELPKVGLVMELVRVIRWLKAVGETVVRGENLLEVETEKSIVEIEAAVTGRLMQILVQVDEEVSVGAKVAFIESFEPQSDQPDVDSHVTRAADAGQGMVQAAAPSTAFAGRVDSDRLRSSPAARKLAARQGIDLAGIAATGPGGRVQMVDVQRAIDADSAPAGAALSSMRRAVARAMTLSNAAIPQFLVASAVDWTVLKSLRIEIAATLTTASTMPSLNDFLLQAVARALIEFPALNATFAGDPASDDARLVVRNGAHIGLVVAVDNGLLVPVIHDVETLSLVEIARHRVDLVERALKGRLPRDELGGTFSISNLGAAGPERFTALINPPQSAILAVGRQRDCVVARQGAVCVRPMSELSLTVDHRVADGQLASHFLARLITLLEGTDWR